MSLNLLRNASVQNNALADTCRKRFGLSFRKRLGVYNYKVKPASYYKNPHSVPLEVKERYKKRNTEDAKRELKALEKNSNTPFGRFTNKGKFIMDYRQLPDYDIPDLNNFPLKPYVEAKGDKLPTTLTFSKEEFTRELLETKIKEQMMASPFEDIVKLAQEIFETEEGKKITNEFFDMKKKKTKQIRLTNF